MELLAALGMEDKVSRAPGQLSGGEQQRVAIAVGLANRPPLLLADEPTGELDTQMAEDVFRMLGEMNRVFGVTVVIVTHFPGVAHFVDRVVHIRDGRISAESYLQSSFQRSGSSTEQEYLVVDRVGRLQLPREYLDKLEMGGLATVNLEDGQITLKPARRQAADHREEDEGRQADR